MIRRPRELKPDKIREMARTIQGFAVWIEAHADEIAKRGNSDCGEAISGRAYDGVNRGGSTSTHPERHALRLEDDPTEAVIDFYEGLMAALKGLRIARKKGEYLTLVSPRPDRTAGSIGAGVCLICSYDCPGTRDDRLKAGLCPNHYQAWVRAGRPDNKRAVLKDEPEDLPMVG